MYQEQNNKLVLAVVDYKTGNTNIDLKYLDYGLYMQLPIYLYLLKKSSKFSHATIAGFYIEQILHDIPNISKKSLEETRKDNLKLQGYTNSDEDIIALIDDKYLEGNIIKGLKAKKDGTLNNYKVLSNEEMDNLTNIVDEKIDEVINNIKKGNFPINPKIIKNKLDSCKYCSFKDICFKTKDDEIIIGGEEDEVNEESSPSSL